MCGLYPFWGLLNGLCFFFPLLSSNADTGTNGAQPTTLTYNRIYQGSDVVSVVSAARIALHAVLPFLLNVKELLTETPNRASNGSVSIDLSQTSTTDHFLGGTGLELLVTRIYLA